MDPLLEDMDMSVADFLPLEPITFVVGNANTYVKNPNFPTYSSGAIDVYYNASHILRLLGLPQPRMTIYSLVGYDRDLDGDGTRDDLWVSGGGNVFGYFNSNLNIFDGGPYVNIEVMGIPTPFRCFGAGADIQLEGESLDDFNVELRTSRAPIADAISSIEGVDGPLLAFFVERESDPSKYSGLDFSRPDTAYIINEPYIIGEISLPQDASSMLVLLQERYTDGTVYQDKIPAIPFFQYLPYASEDPNVLSAYTPCPSESDGCYCSGCDITSRYHRERILMTRDILRQHPFYIASSIDNMIFEKQ